MTDKIIHIEKYDVTAFRKEQKPYAQILNEVIQRFPMSHSSEFLLWCFLESLPETWKPNKQHITDYFSISDRTYERLMSWLRAVGLIEYRRMRNKNGSFAKWELIVLNGTKFNPEAVLSHTDKNDGIVIKSNFKPKVIHNLDDNHTAKIGEVDNDDKTQETQAQQGVSPLRQKATEWVSDAHINTTIKQRKERKKTNKPVSVFSCIESVKTHIEMVIANRDAYIEQDILEQGVYYAYETNPDQRFDSVNKRINIFLKKVREDKWLIPQGYKGITSQSIREQEEEHQREKQEQYRQDGQAFRDIAITVLSPTGEKTLGDILKKLKSG